MFQKIAKHCANDASHTMYRTPLVGGGHPQLVSSPIGLIDYTETNVGPKARATFTFCLNDFLSGQTILK